MHVPIDTTLITHPRLKRLARILDVTVPTAVGHLVCLWCWAIQYAEDGNIDRYDASDLADAAHWTGDPNVFINALKQSAWLNGRGLHAWEKHAGKVVQKPRIGPPLSPPHTPPLFPPTTSTLLKKEVEEGKERGCGGKETNAFSGQFFSISEDIFTKLLSEYKGVPGREWLLRYCSRIDDYVGDNPKRYKKDARGKLKSPSSVIRNWLDRETFRDTGDANPYAFFDNMSEEEKRGG